MVYHSSERITDGLLLNMLSGSSPSEKKLLPGRDSALDPLLIAAAASTGPHVTRNHYAHDFFPGVALPEQEGSWDWTTFTGQPSSSKTRLTYVSRQGPRSQRLASADTDSLEKENNAIAAQPPLHPVDSKPNRPSEPLIAAGVKTAVGVDRKAPPPVQVKCMARTRIPTPHGPVFLHLYHNNRDIKEHLAIVIDSAQFDDLPEADAPPHIRSQSLDAVWNEEETEMDRITRGAYVGRLSSQSQRPSAPSTSCDPTSPRPNPEIPAPLIRIHSECFTGETIGSMRCDCGEQLDEAIRQISQPIAIPASALKKTIPGRGAVIYLRQEGRGIGLLSKIRAYNLQDLGHDTVTANLMLGHKADERGYEIAGAIIRDLGLDDGVRVLTNNPDKVAALENERVRIFERIPMIPRSWQTRHPHIVAHAQNGTVLESSDDENSKPGATMIGGNAVYGDDLDKYMRTKVMRMGHMLPLWLENPDA